MESYENRCGKLPLQNVHHSEAQRNKEQKGKLFQSSFDIIMNSLTGCADVMFSVQYATNCVYVCIIVTQNPWIKCIENSYNMHKFVCNLIERK